MRTYSVTTRLLHWVLASLILVLIALGIAAVELDYYNRWRGDALLWHRQLGIVAFFIIIAKIIGRQAVKKQLNQLPIDFLQPWEIHVARITHWLLLFIALLIAVSGYLISISAGAAIPFFGMQLPTLWQSSDEVRHIAETVHFYMAYLILFLVCLHAGAALKHHFIDKNEVLQRMLWERRR